MPSTVLACEPPGSLPFAADEPDAARAALYALLARLLLAPPDEALRQHLQQAASEASSGELGSSIAALGACACALDAGAMADEYALLFLGPGQPVLDPYGSRFLAGHLHERPLAALRADLRTLGLERRPGVGEPEDHLGALCETMRLLIDGTESWPPLPLEAQRRFFAVHLGPWASRCLEQMAHEPSACLYREVARLGLAFLALEQEAFEAFDERFDDPVVDPFIPQSTDRPEAR